MSGEVEVPRLAPPPEVRVLTDVLDALEELIELTKSTVPRGESPSFLMDITDKLIDGKISYPFPWFSFTIHNYGPNSVYMGVNQKSIANAEYSDEVKDRETREVNMGAAKIREIYLVCKKGEQAKVRIRGVY